MIKVMVMTGIHGMIGINGTCGIPGIIGIPVMSEFLVCL